MKKYTTLIFDLDDTLTNEKENIKSAFEALMKYKKEEFSIEKFEKFNKIDKQFWKDRAEGKIKEPENFNNLEERISWIRAQRFLIYYNNEINLEEAKKLNELYIENLKENVIPIEGAYDIIKYLSEKEYKIVIATNGPLLAVKSKLEKIGILSYIYEIFSAEECGFMKPTKQFFDSLINKIKNENKNEMLIIGDDLLKDIKGGIINNIDTCWFNFKNENSDEYIPTFEIKNLYEIKNIL